MKYVKISSLVSGYLSASNMNTNKFITIHVSDQKYISLLYNSVIWNFDYYFKRFPFQILKIIQTDRIRDGVLTRIEKNGLCKCLFLMFLNSFEITTIFPNI